MHFYGVKIVEISLETRLRVNEPKITISLTVAKYWHHEYTWYFWDNTNF